MAEPAAHLPATHGSFNRRLVKWVDGSPILENVPVFTPAQVTDLMFAAAALPYYDADDELAISMGLPPGRFYGMTNLEVMVIRQQEEATRTGDSAPVLNRLLGLPKATSEVHLTKETYEQYLARIGKTEAAKRVNGAIDVTPSIADLVDEL